MNILTSKKTLRDFGFLLGIGFPIIIGFLIPLITGHEFRIWTIYIGLPLLIIGLIKPKILFWPYKFWMFLGELLGWVNSKIILGLVFLLVLQPIALIMHIIGYDPLRKKRKNKKTYREIKLNSIIDMENIF